jgi:hypothetical protein
MNGRNLCNILDYFVDEYKCLPSISISNNMKAMTQATLDTIILAANPLSYLG